MNVDVSRENEQFIQQVIDSGAYRDRSDVLDEAIQLLRKRMSLLEHIDTGTRQLQTGQYTEYDETSLKGRFAEIKAEGRRGMESQEGEQ